MEFEIITPLTMLVPEEIFEEAHASELMAANGTPVGQDMSVVWSSPREITVADNTTQRVVALMALGKDMLKTITKTTSGDFRYTSPLLDDFHPAAPTIRLQHVADTLYIKVYDTTLRMAEAIPAADEVDLLYFIERAGEHLELRNYELDLAARDTKSLRKTIGKRFKKIICE